MTEELVTQVSRIYERAQNETLALIQSRPAEKIVVPGPLGQPDGYDGLSADTQSTTAPCRRVISCDSTETRLICGQGKKAKGDECKIKSGA